MDARHWKSLIIGFGLPALGVLVIMPIIANTTVHLFGMPLLFLWIFVMFPLTSLCLWVAWRMDEPDYRDPARPGASKER